MGGAAIRDYSLPRSAMAAHSPRRRQEAAMGHVKVSPHQPPVLGNGIYHKDIPFKDEQQFVLALTDWIGGLVMRHRAMHLVMEAAGLQEIVAHIKSAPAGMSLPGPEGRMWRVHAEFFWGRTSGGAWWVSGLGFHIKDSVNSIASANKQIERERLEDIYWERHVRAAPPARILWFEVEKHSSDYQVDLQFGIERVKGLIAETTGIVRELAKMPTNPIGPNPDDPMSILMEFTKVLPGEAANVLKLLGYEARSVFETAKLAVELGDRVRGRIKDNDPTAALADLIEIGLSLSEFAGPWAPFASIILGSFVEIVIAGQAGAVSRVRSHMYACFVGGLMEEIVHETRVKPERPGDHVLYDFGRKKGKLLSADGRYRVQLALMHYGLTHPTGKWNLNALYDRTPPFPEAYVRLWSPAALETSFMVQLCRPDYLYR
jgi:hypothetical protein